MFVMPRWTNLLLYTSIVPSPPSAVGQDRSGGEYRCLIGRTNPARSAVVWSWTSWHAPPGFRGEIVCVDCCAMLTGGGDNGFNTRPITTLMMWMTGCWRSTRIPARIRIRARFKSKRSPDNETVLAHMNQRMLREQFDSIPTMVRWEDLPEDRIIHISRDQFPFWREGSRDATRTPPRRIRWSSTGVPFR